MSGKWACPKSRLVVPLSLESVEQNREQWLRSRRRGIGGSDIAALMNESPFDNGTPWFVWKSKTDPDWNPVMSNQGALTRGNKMEPLVVEEFLAEHPGISARRAGLHQSRSNEVLLANVDRLTSDGGGLECKTTTSSTFAVWDREYGSGEAPLHYVRQCQWYLLVTGRTHWWLSVLAVDTWELRTWRIELDDETAELLEVVAMEFWRTYVEPGVEPEVTALAEIQARYPEDDGESLDLPVGSGDGSLVVSLVQRRRELDAELKTAKAERDALDVTLRELAGGHSEVSVEGVSAFTWKASTSRRLDTSLLRKEQPEVWERYAKETTSRVLRVSASAFK